MLHNAAFVSQHKTLGSHIMTDVAIWRVPVTKGGKEPRSAPTPVESSQISLEKHLEEWIIADPSLAQEGITVVGQQVHIDDGILDLLAIDSEDRWVVIEIKAGQLNSGALRQAIYYASSLAKLSAEELRMKLDRKSPRGTTTRKRLQETVEQLLENEGEERRIAVMLVGVGISPGLSRMIDFLGRFEVPITTVSFKVFAPDTASKLLIREVVEKDFPPPPTQKPTIESVIERAAAAGVEAQFTRFIKMADKARLPIQPHKLSVRVAPVSNRTRFLMYARPEKGGLELSVGAHAFAEFFDITTREAKKAVGDDGDNGFYSIDELDERLDQIERFLFDTLKLPAREEED